MTEEQAAKIKQGDRVIYQGKVTYVTSIKIGLIAGPHFRLDGVMDGLTSYRLVQLPKETV